LRYTRLQLTCGQAACHAEPSSGTHAAGQEGKGDLECSAGCLVQVRLTRPVGSQR
jgi:hypothetical protein